MTPELFALLLRTTAALLWTIQTVRIIRYARDERLRRIVTCGTFAAVLWALVVGGLVPFGFAGEWARQLYTSVATVVLIVGFALVTLDVEED